jgi:two-component system CheB/CheR fusion protein
LARVLPYRTTEDRIDGAVLTFVDITGRRKAEERMRLIAESTRDFAIVTFDTEGDISTGTRVRRRIFGYCEAEVLGQSAACSSRPRTARRRLAARTDAAPRARPIRGRPLALSQGRQPRLPQRHHDAAARRRAAHGYSKIARDMTGSKRRRPNANGCCAKKPPNVQRRSRRAR